MNHDVPGAGALDYRICHYGASRLAFRGPPVAADGRHAVCLGGSETFGRFVPHPWPDRLAELTGLRVVNLGCNNAGIDTFLGDGDVLDHVAKASVTVVQVMGAQNLSNRYYAVHPRRNDRFLGPTPLLRHLFADVDFTEFHFTRHLVTSLAARAPDRFAVILAELRAVWLSRMQALLAQAGGRRIVLWMADHRPGDAESALGSDPWGLDADLLAALAPDCDAIVTAVPGPRARALGSAGMVFSPLEAVAAQGLPGPATHDETAAAVAAALRDLMPT
jgi:hypothetical protein